MRATGYISAAALLWAIAGVMRCGAIQTGLDTPNRPLEPDGFVQLASDMRPLHMTNAEKRHVDNDSDSDEAPSPSHKSLMPGQRPSTNVTSSPAGYDAKHLNRLWGRFTGARANPKEAKQHTPKGGGDTETRASRWKR